jgi:hypothetical protein
MRRTLRTLTTKRLDGRSALAVAVRRWKEDVRRDRGGDLTRAQETILDGAAQKLIIRDSLADYIARQPTLTTRKRQVLTVVVSFLQVSDSLNRDLERLGLERRAKQLDIAAQRAALHRPPATVAQSGESGTTADREEAARPAGPRVAEPAKEEP